MRYTIRQRDKRAPQSAEETLKDIRRATRRQFSAEEKICIGLERLGGEDSIAELCRKDAIAQNLNYRWSKEFLEDGPSAPSRPRTSPSGARRKMIAISMTTFYAWLGRYAAGGFDALEWPAPLN